MTQEDSSKDSLYLYSTLEGENRKLHSQQVRKINSSLRAVRRLSRISQQEFQVTQVAEGIEAKLASSSPGFYVESPSRIDRTGPDALDNDDTGKFCIPEPDETVKFDQVLEKAFGFIERERKVFRDAESSPVIKRWRLV